MIIVSSGMEANGLGIESQVDSTQKKTLEEIKLNVN